MMNLLAKQIRRNIVRTMLSLAIVVCLNTATFAQTPKLTLKERDISVIELLDKIKKETNYSFAYADGVFDANARVDVNSTNKNIEDIVEDAIPGIDIQVDGTTIIILEKTEAISDQAAKKVTITGVVTDSNNSPLIGATVTVDGTNRGTITSVKGDYSIQMSVGETVVFTYTGLETKSIKISTQSVVNVQLQNSSIEVDEVVVVGYGTVRKKDLTGAVSQVKGDDLAVRKTTNLSSALQGSTAGMMVTRSSNEPNASSSINIRGITTISDSSPLVMIDGIPGNLDDVNPEEVESLSVLKDAASASIYGSRAASGVILVTTKRAKSTELSITYSGDVGFEIPTTQPDYYGASRYLELLNELKYNDNPAGGWYQAYTQENEENWVKYNATDPNNYPVCDWYDVMVNDYSLRQTHNITIRGGSENVKTQISANYVNSDALYDHYNYKRYTFRANNDIKVSKMLHAQVDLNFKQSNTDSPLVSPFTGYNSVRTIAPIYAPYYDNGVYADVKGGANMLAALNEGGDAKTNISTLGAKGALNFTPVEGLKISAVVAPSATFNYGKTFRKEVPYYTKEDTSVIGGYVSGFETSQLYESRNNSYNITSQFLANYDKTFGKHVVSAVAGYEQYYSKWENLSASRDEYILTNYPYLDLGPLGLITNSGTADHYAYKSLFGRVAYNFDDRYLIQANVRSDASSRFADGYRWGVFPSFSAAWVVSNEKFMKNLNADWLSMFKLRASYGTLGNERIGSNFPYQANLAFSGHLFYDNMSPTFLQSAAQINYAVNDISWETTSTYDIGFDAQLLDNRLSVTFDYYKKNTDGMLLDTQIPGVIGYNNPKTNAGVMETSGYDIELKWRDNIGKFDYSISANLSDFRSKMVDLAGTQFLGSKVKLEGSEFNEWYGYHADGLFLDEEDLKNSAVTSASVKVGDVKYKDISGPDGVPDGKISSEYDRVLLGGSLPRYMYGLTFNGSLHNFDVSFSLQGVGKQNGYMSSSMVSGFVDGWTSQPSLIDSNYWSSKNNDTQNASAFYPRITYANRGNNYAISDHWMFNGAYLRLKNITLGYTIPKKVTTVIGISNLRVYVAANDIFSIDNYPKGWDPETSGAYPITTTAIMGLSVTF